MHNRNSYSEHEEGQRIADFQETQSPTQPSGELKGAEYVHANPESQNDGHAAALGRRALGGES